MTYNELVKAEREKELVECLTWLQHRMDEYDDKEAYQDDYKMASIAWNFIRARTAENAALKEAQRWVPVWERLPEELTEVLVVCMDGVTIGYIENGRWLMGREGRGIYATVQERVECWQPLPQPPEKG